MKLTFSQWLILLKPETRLQMTMPNGLIYEGKSESPFKFNMKLSEINLGIISRKTGT
jgi:hypothetical protein